MSPPKQHNTWAQAAGKGLNNIGNGSGNTSNSDVEGDQETSGVSASKLMRMDDHVNDLQIAAAFSEGWGQRGVNQDTAWEVPSSPQCSPKEGSAWSSSTSTGTEIWESNIRHHNKCSTVTTQGQMREPWGHTPSTHIGGTWGEEEDATNLWTGVPPSSNSNWGGGECNSSVWGTNPNDGKNWGSQNPPNWGGESAYLTTEKTRQHNNTDDNGPDNGTGAWADASHKPRTFGTWSPVSAANKKTVQPSGWEESSPPVTCHSVPHYDDGTAVWGNPVHQGKVSHWKEMPSNKQMPNCVISPASLCASGSPCTPHAGPGMIRLPPTAQPMNKTDNGWVKNSLGRGLNWTEMPPHRDTPGRRIWEDLHNPLQEKNVPGAPNTPNSAFGSWGESPHSVGTYWGAKAKNSACSWADGQVDTSSWGGPMKQGSKPLTKDLIWASKQFRLLMEMNFKKDDIENALRRNNMNFDDALQELQTVHSKDGSLEMEGLNAINVNQSRVHHSSIADEINFPDQSTDNNFPPGNIYGSGNFQGLTMFSSGFNVAQNCKNQGTGGSNSNPNVLSNAGISGQSPNLNLNNGINNLSPAMVRKLLQQAQTFNPACLPQNALSSQAGRIGQQNFPSTAQLRHLVQQIQMAVQAGHLNPQILNQPLAPQTLQLLYQLLQQIRMLHQLQQQQIFYSHHGSKPGSPSPLQLSVQVTQTKQHIVNLQNQIAAQQAIFLKQQQLQLPIQHPSLQIPQPSAFEVVKSNLDSINGLHSEFRDLSVKDSVPQNHSRLNQWKLPSFEKDDVPPANENTGCGREGNNNNCSSNEFSRAPGSVSKSSSSNNLSSGPGSHSSTSLQPLGENTWSDLPRSQSDSWSDTNEPASSSNSATSNNESTIITASANNSTSSGEGVSNKLLSASDKDSPATSSTNPSTSSSSQSSYNLNDLVPEFEPGKPWKGTSRIKNIEDDPHATPGSIAKSPLSLSSIKDSELFTWNTKTNATSGHSLSSAGSLTSSTWTFSPPPPPPQSSTIQNSNAASAKPGGTKSWGPRTADSDRIPWKGSSMPKTRGPPPGLTGQNKTISSNWMSNDNSHQSWNSSSGWEKQNSSNFLVLRNLTPQSKECIVSLAGVLF